MNGRFCRYTADFYREGRRFLSLLYNSTAVFGLVYQLHLYFFVRNDFIRTQPVGKSKPHKELIAIKSKFLRKDSILNIFITTNNRDLGSWFHIYN